jgi:hypothetical protein
MKDKHKVVKIAETPGLLALAALAHGSNRSVHEDKLARDIDMEGIHLLVFQMVHNDTEWRTLWYVKVKNQIDPVEVWLDLPIDSLTKYTREMVI